ncbi:SusC/RagA family TonB-linked outer membrane protein [Parapedobacter defluvii]|uniref:SusC/RagA family TonB-linked outer membrane protein n=1 Tax=Parapedobacter defluvii TaxID=2045106 RepID=A0ABQ1L1H6_9SPHI|nr:TonB-dependent receptor [Parapedobacter defluvii]GGC15530.1 SusC/RagA family TonB-linked outer membrane protein [Parapedobacter defluvii]
MNKNVLLINQLKGILLMMLALLMELPAQSQQLLDISGTVRDSENQEVLPGVTVTIASSGFSVKTDIDGQFHLQAKPEETLVFRHVGFDEQYVYVDSRVNIDVLLVKSTVGLDEVAVVAYATQKKETITGAIASVKTKELKQSPAANLAVTLAGRLPGLTTLQTSGEPGRDVTALFIRGRATINQTAPIVLIDGIERELTHIDPNEVESITILKDASSTALFGVRGANGVILVTTKRGTSEVPEINLSAEGAVQDFPKFFDMVNSYDYASLRNLALKNDGLPAQFSEKALEMYRTGADPVNYPNTNWRDIMMKDVALQQRYNLNISGTTNNRSMKYFVNATYLNQGGQFNVEQDLPYDPSFKLDRYSFRSNIDLQLNNRLSAFMNVAGYLEKQNMPMSILNRLGDIPTQLEGMSPALYIISFMTRVPANVPMLTPEGEVTTGPNIDWPAYGLLNRSGYVKQTRSNVLATFGMNQELDMVTKGLSARLVMSFDTRSINNLYGAREFIRYMQVINPSSDPTIPDEIYFSQYGGWLNTPITIGGGSNFVSLFNFQAYLNYNRQFDKHAITGMAFYQQQQNIQGIALPFNLRGFAGRLTYGYDNKYFMEFNAGYNGSEQFAKGKRFGFFPAISAGWLISNEPTFKDHDYISHLKLRGSYGLVGNDQLGGRRFLYLDDIYLGAGGYSTSLGLGQHIGINMLKNADITWEIARKTNVGFELGLFNELDLIVDVFKEKRDNILRNRSTIPLINGFPASVLPPVNIGVIENKGYEIELNYRKAVTADLSILTKLNFNHAKNKQLFADEPLLNPDFAYQYRATGYPLGQNFGYIVEGFFKDAEDIANSPQQVVGGHESRPGNFKYKDLNMDGTVNELDMAPLKYTAIPEYTFGAAFNVNYKQWDVSVLFQGVANVGRIMGDNGMWAGSGFSNYSDWHRYSWTPERAANGETIKYPRLTTQASPDERLNDFFYVDGSFLRLRNVELGYTFPVKLVTRMGIKRIRLYTNGLNLYTWDKLPFDGIDPELTSAYAYPIQRLFNFGVNVTF